MTLNNGKSKNLTQTRLKCAQKVEMFDQMIRKFPSQIKFMWAFLRLTSLEKQLAQLSLWTWTKILNLLNKLKKIKTSQSTQRLTSRTTSYMSLANFSMQTSWTCSFFCSVLHPKTTENKSSSLEQAQAKVAAFSSWHMTSALWSRPSISLRSISCLRFFPATFSTIYQTLTPW